MAEGSSEIKESNRKYENHSQMKLTRSQKLESRVIYVPPNNHTEVNTRNKDGLR